jgi:hypothetical protein
VKDHHFPATRNLPDSFEWTDEISADHGPEIGPFSLGPGCGMDAHKPTATLDEVLKGGALIVIREGFVVTVRKDQPLVLFQIGVGEN